MTKKKKIIHSSARTTAHMKKLGFLLIGKVEKWVNIPGHPAGGVRRDLFGWMDILGLDNDGHFIGVQSCSMSGRAAHLEKMADPELASNIAMWMRSPDHRAELWSWRCLKVKRGGTAVTWEVERTPLMMPSEPVSADQGSRLAEGALSDGLFTDGGAR